MVLSLTCIDLDCWKQSRARFRSKTLHQVISFPLWVKDIWWGADKETEINLRIWTRIKTASMVNSTSGYLITSWANGEPKCLQMIQLGILILDRLRDGTFATSKQSRTWSKTEQSGKGEGRSERKLWTFLTFWYFVGTQRSRWSSGCKKP